MIKKCANCEYETNELFEDDLCSVCSIEEQDQINESIYSQDDIEDNLKN